MRRNLTRPGIQNGCAGFFCADNVASAFTADEISPSPLARPLNNFPLGQRPLLTSPFGKGGLRGILITDNVASPFTGDEVFLEFGHEARSRLRAETRHFGVQARYFLTKGGDHEVF